MKINTTLTKRIIPIILLSTACKQKTQEQVQEIFEPEYAYSFEDIKFMDMYGTSRSPPSKAEVDTVLTSPKAQQAYEIYIAHQKDTTKQEPTLEEMKYWLMYKWAKIFKWCHYCIEYFASNSSKLETCLEQYEPEVAAYQAEFEPVFQELKNESMLFNHEKKHSQ